MTNNAEKIWRILDEFRLKHFFSSPEAVVDVGDFDAMMDKLKKYL